MARKPKAEIDKLPPIASPSRNLVPGQFKILDPIIDPVIEAEAPATAASKQVVVTVECPGPKFLQQKRLSRAEALVRESIDFILVDVEETMLIAPNQTKLSYPLPNLPSDIIESIGASLKLAGWNAIVMPDSIELELPIVPSLSNVPKQTIFSSVRPL